MSKTQLLLFTDPQKVIKKLTWAIYRPDRKSLQKYWKVDIGLSINEITKKPSNIKLASVSEDVRKDFWDLLTQMTQFTDQQI